MNVNKYDRSHAEFSPCRTYRYTLWRSWNRLITSADNYVNFIMLNPSTADEYTNDRTVSKCIKFARSWGYDGLCVTNLFAYRSTHPIVLKTVDDPIGVENDAFVIEIAESARLIVAAWSQHGTWFGRSAWAKSMISRPMHYLRMGTGKNPEPWHPLYLPDNSKPVFWYQ